MSTLSQATAQLEAHFVHPWSEDDKGKLDGKIASIIQLASEHHTDN